MGCQWSRIYVSVARTLFPGGVSTKIGKDQDKMERLQRVHIRTRVKSDTWSQKKYLSYY